MYALLIAFLNTEFKPEGDDETAEENAEDAEDADEAAEEEGEEAAEEGEEAAAEIVVDAALCAQYVDGQEADIVMMSDDDDDLELNENSILVVEAKGETEIELEDEDLANIKGLCVYSAGNASVTIDSTLGVANMYYYGRGDGTTEISFGENGTLQKLTADVAGNNMLSVKGDAVDCMNLEIVKMDGNSTITCNDQPY